MLTHLNFMFRTVLLTAFVSSLVACGGGGGGDNNIPTSKEKSVLSDLTLTFGGEGKGLVTLNPSETVCDSKCVKSFTTNTVVTFSHKASSGSNFIGWSGDADCIDGKVTMSDKVNCTVIFDLDSSVPIFELKVILGGLGSGSVISTPSGINCTTTECIGPFEKDSVVTLTAEPAVDNTFVGWSDDCVDMAAITTVTMSTAKTCTASFDIKPSIILHNLSVTLAGAGSAKGRVTSNPSGIDCGAACNKDFAVDTKVTLTATTSDSTANFTGWSGSCSGPAATTSVTMTTAKNCIATFEPVIVFYNLTSAGNFGKVTSNPSGIDCGNPCNSFRASFAAGTVVTLTASPTDTNQIFVRWLGACIDITTLTTTVTMTTDIMCNAEFKIVKYTLSIAFLGVGGGSVSSTSPTSLISCSTTNPGNGGCSSSYDGNTVVTLLATPFAGNTFGGWSGTGCGNTITMAADRNCIAIFN